VSRDWRLYADDIAESARRVIEYTRELGFEQFVADTRTYDAVLRNLEIIGEAAKRVPPAVCERYPDVPWSAAARFRDRLAHGYHALDDAVIWRVIREEVPLLQAAVLRVLADE
jgi:uncharacterized protein with HEPN domain